MMKEEETSEQWLEWICEAIKKIRNQKQRPSLERVINAIKLHTPYTDNVITSRLEDFVEKGQILKILNKGKASFKDPGTNQNRFIVIDKETDLVKIVVKAVKDLDAGDGTQFKHIEKYVPQSHCLDVKPDVDLSSLLKISLKRAVERNLLLQDGKTYKALPEDPKSLKSPKTPVVKKAKPEVEKEVITSPKTPGRKKKVNEETPKKSGLPICSECLGTAKRNKLGAEEALSICNGCGASIHPSCAAKGDLFTVLISKGNIWHCEECATCTKCRSTDKVCIWKCGACERGYHLDCMSPAVDKKSKTPWKCCYCVEGKPEKNSDAVTSHPNTPTTPMTSPRKQKSLRTQQLRSLSKAARAIGKKAQKRSLSIESSSEDGNDEPNQSPSYPTSYPPSGGRRIEISDTISKEKQKFFRCSAFIKRSNAVKTDREPEAPKLNAITPVTPLTQFPRHIPPLNPNSSEMRMPFGSDDSDEPWGFAAVKFEAAKVGNAKEKGRRWKKDAPKHKSPSSLVKSAVNSKIHGIERKKLIAEGRAAHRLTLDEWSSERHSDAAAITSIISNELPPGVTQKDLETFKIARENASKLTKPNLASADLDISGSGTLRCPASLEFGQHHIHTWYSSPFPQEYARLGKLFLCEYCLKYTKSKAVLKRHLHKCTWRHPPGTEIYRHENLSVFEVDGNVAKFYCQNLCLLAKLFLDHKTLYYDVEPFLFYVLTKNDEQGFHLVGYFSKEKHCLQKYNVSCIMTLPHYQRQGFGRFLIDFSYLLSKQEGQPGTPEKPLSDLGRVSYHAYWKSVILEYLNEHRDEDFSIKELCKESGVKAQDIAEMLQIMGMIRPSKVEGESKVVLAVDWSLVDTHAEKVKKSIRIKIEPECLRWTPLIPTLINPYKIINSENEEDEDKGDSDEEDNKVDVEEVDSKPQKSEKVELKTPKVESKSPKSEKVEIKTPKIQLDLKKVEKTESKVEKEDEIAVSTPEVKTAPKSTRVKQSLLPALFKKQKEMAEVAKVEEPSIEKRRRGTKKKYTEIEEDDDETSQVEPPPEKKKKKTIEPSPLIKPSRLKIPETPITPMEVAETPETVNGRRTRRPRLTDTKEDEKLEEEEEAEVEDKTPKLSRRQIAARERWAKKKQKVEEVQEENDVDVEEPEEETPAKNTRKKPKRDMKEEVEEDVETPKKEKKAKKKELPKEKVKRSKKIETDSEGEKSDEIESRISKRKSLRGASKVEEVERRRGRSRLAKTKKEVPTRKSLRVMADDTDTQSSEVDDDVQPETPPRPRSAGNSAISSDEDVAEPQKPKLEEESINNINNDESLPPPILPPAVSDRESQEDEIEKKKKEEELKKEEEKKKKEEERKKKEEERKKKEEEKRKEEEEKRKEELRKKQEEELRRKEEEEIARKKHEEELRIKQEEKRREEELKRKEEEEIRLKEEEEKKRKEEEMRRIQEEENRKKLEEEMRKKEELRLKEEEEKKKQEEERRKREEEEFLRRKKEEEERQRMEEELRRKEAEERKRIEDEERRRREDDERRKREEEERRKREDEERRKREEEARKKEMLKMPSSISVPIPNYPMPQSAPLIHPVGPPLIHHPPLLHPVKSELKPEEYDITKSLKKDEKVDKEKGFTEVKKPMEVDLTEDSRSPATKDETHDKNLKKAQKPYDPKHPYPPPVKDKKEKKHEEHKREELKCKVPVYNEHPNQVHPMYTGCGEMDVNMMEPQSNEMLEQQRLQQQYSDCAQQSLLHHHHLTPSPHMNMVYQQQRKQVARSSGSNNQRHHHPSPPSHYHQSPNYIMPQNSPYVSVLSHRVQNPQRISPSCSVSSPNLYFQQQNSPNSLVQLQKLTNGLESIPGHGTPPPRVDLTPPPNHSTPPNPYKYQYQRHITPAPQRPHNVLQYNTFNNYSRPQSPSVAGYIANSASFINQAQLPMQMMQPQYPQDPQQNTMYPNVPYGYHINSPLMQPLNGTMRR